MLNEPNDQMKLLEDCFQGKVESNREKRRFSSRRAEKPSHLPKKIQAE